MTCFPNNGGRRLADNIALALALLLCLVPTAFAATGKVELTTAEKLKLGERMYREGVLPSGEPMEAFVNGDVPVSGASFTCISCHLRSGLGSIEGDIVTPPTNGRILYLPRTLLLNGFEMVPTVRKYALAMPERPAYTDQTLAKVIASGVDPTGRTLNPIMPTYHVDDADMALLIGYLKTLSDQVSPGVSKGEIHFATVIAGDVDPAEVEAMLRPLDFYIAKKNGVAATFKRNPWQARMALSMLGPDLAAKTLSLSRWHLSGPPDTWGAQLEEYYRKDPVFALLGGISNGSWEPVHRFSEDHQIPCLFPTTDFPVISDSDRYTLYFNKGIYQEGEGAARYLHSIFDVIRGKGIVQVAENSPGGRTLAKGFLATWKEYGHPAPVTVEPKEGIHVSQADLQAVLEKEKPAALLLWDGAQAQAILEMLAQSPTRPQLVIVSSGLLGKALWSLPETVRGFTYISWPYRLPQEDVRYDAVLQPILRGKALAGRTRRIFEEAYDTSLVQSQALIMMRGEYYRDFFFDSIDMIEDLDYPLYERLTFGPGQRNASKGCYMVQLAKGEKPELIKRSDWVIH
jgi:hypothetical protein